nr:HPr family phosphocarrier protein [Maliibacterium massiliense]
MKEATVTVLSAVGLHARPATIFVTQAAKFRSDISVLANDRKTNGKSILGVLSLGVQCNQRITIRAEGPDEETAIQALEQVIRQGDEGIK